MVKSQGGICDSPFEIMKKKIRDNKITHGDPHLWGGDEFQFGDYGTGILIDNKTRNGYGAGIGFIIPAPLRPALPLLKYNIYLFYCLFQHLCFKIIEFICLVFRFIFMR